VRIMKSFIVLGLGRFGKSLASTLYKMGHEVLCVDEDERVVQEFSRHATLTVQADLTSEEFLKTMDIEHFDAAIVAVGANMQVSIMATVLLKELGAKYILVKAQDDLQERVLYKVGADKVILPERDTGIKVARNLTTDNFFDMIEISADHSIINIRPPEAWFGKTLGELAIRAKYGINIIAVKNGDAANIIPTATTVLTEDSVITVMGTNTDLRRITNIK